MLCIQFYMHFTCVRSKQSSFLNYVVSPWNLCFTAVTDSIRAARIRLVYPPYFAYFIISTESCNVSRFSMLSTLQTILIARMPYHYLITNFGNMLIATHLTWCATS